ncbi:MAG: copper chaperone PCu(A)C [Anaerolineales bacterium]
MRHHWLIIALLTISLLLSGCRTEGAGITISNAWARPGFEGGNSAVYFVIENSGVQDDSLHRAEATVAASVELHESMMDSSGTMSMHEQHSISVPAKDQIAFQPGGLHVMLIDLTQDLNVGDRFNLTLTFEGAGQVPVDVEVRQ